jgi:hypothetical protein
MKDAIAKKRNLSAPDIDKPTYPILKCRLGWKLNCVLLKVGRSYLMSRVRKVEFGHA